MRGFLKRYVSVVVWIGFFLLVLFLPLTRLLLSFRSADIKSILVNAQVGKAIIHSVSTATAGTAISVSLALTAAYCVNRTNIRFKSFFHILLILPMFLPTVSHGTGMVILLGSNGILTKLLKQSVGIYGFWGIVFGSVLYAFPLAYLMFSDILKYENYTPYEAAKVLGIPKKNQWGAISMPYLYKPTIGIVFSIFTTIVTDYGVPLAIGGLYKTLPVLMYEEVIGRLNFEKGCVFGSILLLPAVVAFFTDSLSQRYMLGDSSLKQFESEPNQTRDNVAYVFLILLTLCIVMPIASFLPVAFSENYPLNQDFTLSHWFYVFSTKNGFKYLMNSFIIALAVSIIGVCSAFACAYSTARVHRIKILHFFSMMSLAVPGVVLGISYVLLFKSSFLYGSFAILIMVNTIHFFASPYLMLYNSLGKLNANLESVAASLRIDRVHLLWDIIIPQSKSTLLEAFAYFFANSMITISAISFLVNRNTRPISLMLTEFDASQTLLAPTAVVSLVILICNLIMKGIVCLVKRRAGIGDRSAKNAVKKI